MLTGQRSGLAANGRILSCLSRPSVHGCDWIDMRHVKTRRHARPVGRIPKLGSRTASEGFAAMLQGSKGKLGYPTGKGEERKDNAGMELDLGRELPPTLRCATRSVRKISGTRRILAMGVLRLNGQNENALFWFCVAFP